MADVRLCCPVIFVYPVRLLRFEIRSRTSLLEYTQPAKHNHMTLLRKNCNKITRQIWKTNEIGFCCATYIIIIPLILMLNKISRTSFFLCTYILMTLISVKHLPQKQKQLASGISHLVISHFYITFPNQIISTKESSFINICGYCS